jgi:hypothetical protein
LIVEANVTELIVFGFGTLKVSVTVPTLPPLTTIGGKFRESMRELVVGSTYDANVLGIAVVLTRSTL